MTETVQGLWTMHEVTWESDDWHRSVQDFLPYTQEIKMGLEFEDTLMPDDYMVVGDFAITRPPIVNTTLGELASLGYRLWVNSRYVPVHQASKTRIRFVPKTGVPCSSLSYTTWHNFRLTDRKSLIDWMADTFCFYGMRARYPSRHHLDLRGKTAEDVIREAIIARLDDGSTFTSKDGRTLTLVDLDDHAGVLKMLNDRSASKIDVSALPDTFPEDAFAEIVSEIAPERTYEPLKLVVDNRDMSMDDFLSMLIGDEAA